MSCFTYNDATRFAKKQRLNYDPSSVETGKHSGIGSLLQAASFVYNDDPPGSLGVVPTVEPVRPPSPTSVTAIDNLYNNGTGVSEGSVFGPLNFYAPDNLLVENPIEVEDDDEDMPPKLNSVMQLSSKVWPSAAELDPNYPLGQPCIELINANVVANGFNHSPLGTWIGQATWDAAEWDGVTIMDPCIHGISAVCNWMFPLPSGWAMRGLKQLYDQLQPFADINNPTVAEVEQWNLEVLRLFRRLMGITTPVDNSRELYLRAHWSDERKFSDKWGPKLGTGNAHNGATFVPTCEQQLEYLEPGEPCYSYSGGGAEGIHTVETDWPWSIHFSRVLRGQLCGNGLTGHGGPYVSRTKMGFSWKCNGWTGKLRGKWEGNSVPICGGNPIPP